MSAATARNRPVWSSREGSDRNAPENDCKLHFGENHARISMGLSSQDIYGGHDNCCKVTDGEKP